MAEHYFTARPSASHRIREVREELRGRPFSFLTDAGVFAKRRVDPGTRLLIRCLPLPVEGNALDLGCGYGPIGTVIGALSPGARVFLIDVNERAADLARRNLERNGVTGAQVLVGDGFEPVAGTRFVLIASNPPLRAGKRVVYEWVRQAFDRLVPGGCLFMVARTSQGALSLARHMESVFGRVEEVAKGGGYRVLSARRPEHPPGPQSRQPPE
ncbi:MAG: class I SAM-dependent methyltransferase [Firmicutes bacterium]|nr:class I SAM-dependent methyltransferase [Bacillota bacterium]